MMGGGGKVRGWKIKLGESLGFGYSGNDGYCIPLSDDTPKFESFYLFKNFPTYLVELFPQFSYCPKFQLYADQGIIYREDNPNVIYPAIGYNNQNSGYTLLDAFYPIFLNKGESIETCKDKEYTILYDPTREWKPTNKLTVSIIQYRADNDEAAIACCYSSEMRLPDYTTLVPQYEYMKIGSTYEFALTYDYFYMTMNYEAHVQNMVNCEQLKYTSQYGILFKVTDPSKDVSIEYATYDPT